MIDGPSLMRWVVGFEGRYLVHRDGRVFNRHARQLAVRVDRYGYANVRLERDGKQSWKKVHRLVCEAFNGRPTAEHCAHLDNNPLNNCAENLAWVTPKENNSHKTGFNGGFRPGEKHPHARLSAAQVAAIRASGQSTRKLAAEYRVNQSQIVRIRRGERWANG